MNLMQDPYTYIYCATFLTILNLGIALGSKDKNIIDKIIYSVLYGIVLSWLFYIISGKF